MNRRDILKSISDYHWGYLELGGNLCSLHRRQSILRTLGEPVVLRPGRPAVSFRVLIQNLFT